MTTIAARFSSMEIAADSAVGDQESFYLVEKLRRGKNGIYGACGEFLKILSAYDFMAQKSGWSDDLDVQILELRPDGIWVYESSPVPIKIKNDYWAIGSGGSYALAAMRLGLSPVEAVAIACEFDASSRPPIDSMRLEIVRGRKPKTSRY